MDSQLMLQKIRELIREYDILTIDQECDRDSSERLLLRLAGAFNDLDRHLSAGGMWPNYWTFRENTDLARLMFDLDQACLFRDLAETKVSELDKENVDLANENSYLEKENAELRESRDRLVNACAELVIAVGEARNGLQPSLLADLDERDRKGA
ncbi:hypothetical protein [Nocardia macrotermitis]|uniref:Uncharacterized protein n=1 Tax=Nocardia macrotermitis TaxID=2585198 RepID=A0A7K0DBJ7_9NOCA|nr:hypothetical protein [Nocardia macrotermitis]MQY22672.1 hypothetical protein [Nocardia macrotermitis]